MVGWSTNDMPRLDGRRAIVTGANSGLGYEVAKALAGHGARVVMACRDAGRGGDALARLRAAVPDAVAELGTVDLADLASVRRFAAGQHEPLDLLVNNAGVMAIPRRQTADGFEMQFGTNHLGHFALTGLLLPCLAERPGARVVTITSLVAHIGRIDFADLQGARRYSSWGAYGQSKLANQLFTLELDRRARARGLDLVSAAAHPGYAATNLQHGLLSVFNHVFAQSAAAGSLPALHAATAPGVVGGSYYGPALLARGHPRPTAYVRAARDEETARRLWGVSEELTGVRFEALDPAP